MPRTGMYLQTVWLGGWVTVWVGRGCTDRVGRKNWVSVCVGRGWGCRPQWRNGDVQTQTGSTSNRIGVTKWLGHYMYTMVYQYTMVYHSIPVWCFYFLFLRPQWWNGDVQTRWMGVVTWGWVIPRNTSKVNSRNFEDIKYPPNPGLS